jgi:hypothetical protein
VPPLPVIADTFRCALNWETTNAQHAVNVIHIRAPGKTVDEIGPGLQAAVSHDMWVAVHEAASVTSIDVLPLDGSGVGVEFLPTDETPWTGTGGLDFIPAVSCLIKYTTLLRGRSFRGRQFLPFVSEEASVNGFLLDTAQATMQTDWDAWLVNLNAAGFQPVVASYSLAVAHTIQVAKVESALATQRRRQERVRAA